MTQDRSHSTAECPPSTNKGSRRLKMLLGSVSVIALCIVIRHYWQAEPANADTSGNLLPCASRSQSRPAVAAQRPTRNDENATRSLAAAPSAPAAQIVATVNRQRITRDELALQCRRTYGQEVLESMVNKRLIVEECKQHGISVSRADVDAEIQRMAKRFNIPVDQWLKLLKQERNVTPEQYANDIIWPTLALRKLARGQLEISREDLVKEFETDYGEAVRARLIAVSDLEKAKSLQAQAAANPKEFGNLAKDNSEDAPSASLKGIIQPIRRHGPEKSIEDAVFNMADGEVSQVIQAGGQYVILKREELIPAQKVSFEQVAPQLQEILRDRKLRSVAQDVFQQLQKTAKIENVWNDPVKRQRMPGVAAMINGSPITIQELDEECIARHGRTLLEGMITRKLLEQECQKRDIAVTDQDIDAEITRAAMAGVKPKPDGTVDVDAWLELVTKKEGIPLHAYRNDVVWPSCALKKLAVASVKVTEEDLQKGFEANFGPRVRCLAIVLDNERRAQQVFEMARKKNTAEYFGELAVQYSVEPGSQAMHGEVPPIKMHGGQPNLEDEAFQLKPGELSGLIKVGDKFVILRCEGYTKAANVEFATVRKDIYDDLHEKKLHLAMAECLEDLQDAATIDNYLAGTSHAPKQRGGVSPSGRVPSLRQVPGG